MNKFLYALGGAAVASLVLYITMINPVVPAPSGADRDSTQGPQVTSDSARPQSGGGGGYAGIGMERGSGIAPAMDIPVTSESKMIAPGEPYPYTQTATEYIYDGDLKLGEEKTVAVMRRIQPKVSAKADLLGGTFVGNLVNVDKLDSLNVINVTLSESGPEPLNVYVDFMDGSVSVNRQINYTQRPDANCQNEACFARYRLKESDMPSDDRVFEIATKFLKDLGVDTSKYGDPVLAYNWREQRMMMPVGAGEFYFPESMDVSFPYMINGSPVYDEWGNASGMNVTVDIRLRAAIGVWGLKVMNLESSEYDAVTDPAVLLAAVRQGGVYGYMPEDATTVQATLGDPEKVYMVHYKYDEKKQENYELYVPALAFPVTEQAEGMYDYRKAVVVPLASELLTVENGGMPKPLPMPLEPLMEGDVNKGMPVPGSSVDEMEVYPDGGTKPVQRPMEDGFED